MEDINFEGIKNYFGDADPEVRESIVALERGIKTAKLYNDLAKHDAVKMILGVCTTSIAFYESFLRNQTAEELAEPSARAKRARFEAYRDSFMWFKTLFTIAEKKEQSLGKKAADLAAQAGEK